MNSSWIEETHEDALELDAEEVRSIENEQSRNFVTFIFIFKTLVTIISLHFKTT